MSAWFYFRCEGLKGEINFILTGFKKNSSLYNHGMKICFRDINQTPEWKRCGKKISYTSL